MQSFFDMMIHLNTKGGIIMAYFLSLEKRPGDFMPLNISLLSYDNMKDYSSLENIDEFTRKYTKKELLDIIKNSNIVTPDYLEGNLLVINDKKYRYPLFTKDITMSLDTFFINNINDKQIMNKFINIYLKYSSNNISLIKEAIKEKKVDIILQNLFLLSYENIRFIYFYLYNHIN